MVRGVEITGSIGGLGMLNTTPEKLNNYVNAKIGKIIDEMVASGKPKPKAMEVLLTDDLVPDLKEYNRSGKLNDKLAVIYTITNQEK